MEIALPYQFQPRQYQLDFWKAFDSGLYDRFVIVWHRRAGKDLNCFALLNRFLIENVCTVTYVFPTLKQGREVLWEGMDNEGHKFIDYYVPDKLLAKKPNESRMTLEYKNGSMFRIGGSDNPDSLRGGNTKLFVFSEWAEQDPYTWTVVRPIVKANKGIAIFNFTPKGDNHAKKMYNFALGRKNWFAQLLTAQETEVFTSQELQDEKAELIQELGTEEGSARFEQEYQCSFEQPVSGSYYGRWIQELEQKGHITQVSYDNNYPVTTYFDLGMNDTTAIWFMQLIGKRLRIIDCYETSGEGLEYYIQYLRQKPYKYSEHYAPHDIQVRELGTGRSRWEVAHSLGLDFRIVPNISIEDGIQAVRTTLPLCDFDIVNCDRGLEALKNYHKEWDERNKTFKNYPKHDWSSNFADSFRYMSVIWHEKIKAKVLPAEPYTLDQINRARIEAERKSSKRYTPSLDEQII